MEKLGQETAFPVTENIGSNGMSKRFYVASLAMQSLIPTYEKLEKVNVSALSSVIARKAYELADELLKQELL